MTRVSGSPLGTDPQAVAPYAQAVRRHATHSPLHLMVPGHCGDPEAGAAHLHEYFGGDVVRRDVPLMLDGVDLGPDSPLAQSHELAARAWGAARAWFLTNGASQGNRTAALAVRGLGERVLMQRSAHSSFTDGVLLAGLIPAFLRPSIDERHGISHGITPAALDAALSRESAAGRNVASVYVVSPSYFGSTADVAGLAETAHRHGAALVVDGAWGAHFGFHPELPDSPTRLGADLVISSTHKLAGSLTQSAMLHLGNGPLAAALHPLVERAVTMTASTSESALLIASLDLARRALATGREQIGEAIDAADRLRESLREDPRFALVETTFGEFPDIVAADPLRIAIDISRLGRSGHWVRKRLIAAHGVYAEMSTATTVVLVIGALAQPDSARAFAALAQVADECEQAADTLRSATIASFPALPVAGPLRMLPRAAYFAEAVTVPAEDAVGRVSADTLAAYPPGIPNLVPGEEITEDTVRFLQAVAAAPTGYVRGAEDSAVRALRVVRDPVTASLQG